ncbi:MAG: ATP-binding protein [Deltaproteobacteria bacterium]|nr:ATP-binding protein [Deltaproteobacteria bacterium]
MEPPTDRNSLRGLLSAEPGSFPEAPCALTDLSDCCRGNGYLFRPVGAFTKAELCPCVLKCRRCFGTAQQTSKGVARSCRTPSPRKVVSLFNNAAIPSRYADAHLGVFENMSGNCLKVVHDVRQWQRHFLSSPKRKGLIISGTVGVGKTYLITALARAVAEKGVSVRFVDFFQLLSQIRACYSENKSDHTILRPLYKADVLFVDELGKGRNTEFEAVVLDQLIMNRYNENKILVASTNLYLGKKRAKAADKEDQPAFNQIGSLEERVGERVFSRLKETTEFLEIQGKDFRQLDKL